MATTKKIIAVILSMILIACPVFMIAGAIELNKIELPELTIITMIKELFEKIKVKIKEILAKLGFPGPSDKSIFEPREWGEDERLDAVYAPVVDEYIQLINNAKSSAYSYVVQRHVYNSYSIAKTVGGDMSVSVMSNVLDKRFPGYTNTRFSTFDEGANMSMAIDPFAVNVSVSPENVKKATRTVNTDNTITIRLDLYSEKYSEKSSIHSGLTSYCYSKDDNVSTTYSASDIKTYGIARTDFNSSMLTVEEFQGYISGATFSVTFNTKGQIIAQEYIIPAYYDFAGSYIVGKTETSTNESGEVITDETTAAAQDKTLRGRGFCSVDVLTRINYDYTLAA